MISFRYHIVSIVAVFLALALGIVVGTTALNGPITKDLRNQVNDVKTQRDDLAGQVKTLQGRVDDAGEFASTYGAQLVSGALTGKSVVLVSLPGASSSMRDGITDQITAAGGTVSGDLTLLDAYLDQSRGSDITALATSATRPSGLTLPVTSDPGKLGGALLAYVLLGKGQRTDLTQVVSGLSERHLVSLGDAITPGTTVIVLGKGALPADSYGAGAQLSLVDALARGGGKVVVAGDDATSTEGGIIAEVRDASADRDALSTVDDADTSFGQVSTVLALSAALKGQPGHYGVGKGADALFPSPTK